METICKKMKAGQTEIEVGTRVQIDGVKGEDKYLNGLIGSVTHPFAFGCTGKDWVGVYLESGNVLMPLGGKCNVKINEIKTL